MATSKPKATASPSLATWGSGATLYSALQPSSHTIVAPGSPAPSHEVWGKKAGCVQNPLSSPQSNQFRVVGLVFKTALSANLHVYWIWIDLAYSLSLRPKSNASASPDASPLAAPHPPLHSHHHHPRRHPLSARPHSPLLTLPAPTLPRLQPALHTAALPFSFNFILT